MLNFLSLSKEFYGLEITDSCVRIMRLIRRNGRFFVATAGCLHLSPGIVRNGEVKDEKKLTKVVSELTAKFAIGNKNNCAAVVSLPENKSFWQIIKMPRLNPDELSEAVLFEAENYIPLPLEKVYLDFEIIPSPAIGNYCEVAIAAIPKEIADVRARICDAAKLPAAVMELESQAVVRSARQNPNFVWPLIIVKINDTQSSVIFCDRNSTRGVFSVPISNNYFIEKISAALSVGVREAEELKNDYGIADDTCLDAPPNVNDNERKRKIFESLMPGLVDFAQQIKKYVSYYQNHEKNLDANSKFFRKMILCGDGSNLKGLDDFLTIKLKIPTERMILPISIDASRFKHDNFLIGGAHGCAVAAGLAMRAMAMESEIIDMLL